MKHSNWKRRLLALWLFLAALWQPASTLACATCFGQSDSSLAKGATFGILFLLAVIMSLLGGIGAFFVTMARRAAAVRADESQPPPRKS